MRIRNVCLQGLLEIYDSMYISVHVPRIQKKLDDDSPVKRPQGNCIKESTRSDPEVGPPASRHVADTDTEGSE